MCIVCGAEKKRPPNRGARWTYSLCAFCGEYGWREHEHEYLKEDYLRKASKQVAQKRHVMYLDGGRTRRRARA